MLQQAIVLSLFPDHDVQVSAGLPPQSEAETFDAIVIDTSDLAPEQVDSLARWNVPMIVINSEKTTDGWNREDVACVAKPVAKKSLEAAVVRCLAARPPKANGREFPERDEEPTIQADLSKDPGEAPVIDLTEIIEDETAANASESSVAAKK